MPNIRRLPTKIHHGSASTDYRSVQSDTYGNQVWDTHAHIHYDKPRLKHFYLFLSSLTFLFVGLHPEEEEENELTLIINGQERDGKYFFFSFYLTTARPAPGIPRAHGLEKSNRKERFFHYTLWSPWRGAKGGAHGGTVTISTNL